MKKFLLYVNLLLALCLTSVISNAQTNKVAYDSVLAHKLHADDYGMKKYVMV